MGRLGHFGRIMVLWFVVAAISMTLAAIFLTPILPPGTGSAEASGQRFDNEVLILVSFFVCALIFAYFGYVLVVFRARDSRGTIDGPPIRGNMVAQTTWIATTSAVVLLLAGFGTYELLGGAGGGQGSKPVFTSFSSAQVGKPGDPPLQVQVIAQQWQFTYRYPDEGGFETADFELPVDRQVELHVTSLDVIHSFWIPALGLKADANPGADNIAYITPKHLGNVHIECAELCGLFHGYMFGTGRVVSEAAFATWVKQQQALAAPVMRYMPRYGNTYLPAPPFRAG
ncbi:MAG: cytochrome c oxidase subunit II [Gaiellaceae bacterium]